MNFESIEGLSIEEVNMLYEDVGAEGAMIGDTWHYCLCRANGGIGGAHLTSLPNGSGFCVEHVGKDAVSSSSCAEKCQNRWGTGHAFFIGSVDAKEPYFSAGVRHCDLYIGIGKANVATNVYAPVYPARGCFFTYHTHACFTRTSVGCQADGWPDPHSGNYFGDWNGGRCKFGPEATSEGPKMWLVYYAYEGSCGYSINELFAHRLMMSTCYR